MKRQKISKIIIVALACLFLIAAIILFIINNKTNEKDNEMVDNADINEISPVADVSIDLNYKDNVEIKNNTKYNNSNEIKGKHYLIHEDKNNNNI